MKLWLYRGAAGVLALALFGVVPAFGQGSPIPRGNWSVHYVDSEDTEGGYYPATNAFDGDPYSLWVTDWWASSPPPPHELQIDLGAVYDVSGFSYLPRQDGMNNGSIGAYEFFVSADGVNWGPAATSGHFQDYSGEQQATFASRSGRYVRLRVVTEIAGRPWTALAELYVLSGGGSSSIPPVQPALPSGGAISQANWVVHFVDSQDTLGGDFAARNAFDGNPWTMWATEWYASSPMPPHELQIDLRATYSIDGIRYLPRQDGWVNGQIGAYQIYVSADGVNWGGAVASGTFQNGSHEQQVNFAAKSGRFVRLRALSEVNGYPWSTVAELNVLASGGQVSDGGGTPPPPPSSAAPRRVAFAPSADHHTLVQRYVVEVFWAGSDPWGSTPVARLDVGVPAVANGECSVDVSQLVAGLPPGSYFGTILVEGFGGTARSNASPTFVIN